jgi:hypothetical protein
MEQQQAQPSELPNAQQPEGHALWSFSNAVVTVILLCMAVAFALFGSSALFDIKRIKADWANQRCTPLIMPFAGWFGVSARENFEFCMGKVFTGHSQPYLGSITSIFTKFTGLLQMIFQSINSMRNTVATLGGGINVILQEFTERISMFFYRLRLSSIHLKSLFMRMYALLFSVMYMGMSGVTGMTSFTNTFLFSFLDTFCFPGDTLLRVVREQDGKKQITEVPIREVVIGDSLYPSMDRVTALFQFQAKGQPMVRLGDILVSTNHYVYDAGQGGKRVRAEDHSEAIPVGPWASEEPLYCLNTDTHHIPIHGYIFMDYDEVPTADGETMRWVEEHVNGPKGSAMPMYSYHEYGMAVHPSTGIRMATGDIQAAETLRIGDRLSTGGTVAGVIRKQVSEKITLEDGIQLTPSTLHWDSVEEKWKRFEPQEKSTRQETFCSFVVIPHSQIELSTGLHIRDYMEWCSPDTEQFYTQHLAKDSV